MTNKAPALQLYAKEFLADPKVRRMSGEGQAFYALLLINMWNMGHENIEFSQCSIVDDDKIIAATLGISLSRWKRLREIYLPPADPLLKLDSGRLVSERLREEARKTRYYREMKRKAGRASASAKSESCCPAVEHPFNPPTPSPSSTAKKKHILSKQQLEWFETVWADYPNKAGGKKAALRHFKASVKSESDLQQIAAALDKYKAHVHQKRKDGFGDLQWQGGARWFNEWRDWIGYTPTDPAEEELLRTYPTREALLNRKEHLTKLIPYSTDPDELRAEVELIRILIGKLAA